MDPKIPVSTDNIYKFLATFGLVVMVVSMSLLIFNGNDTNRTVWRNANAIYDLQNGSDPAKEKRIKILNREIEVAVSNREFGQWALSLVFAVGFFSCVEGFRRWFKEVQPIHDEILALQKRKLELEVTVLSNSVNSGAKSSAD